MKKLIVRIILSKTVASSKIDLMIFTITDHTMPQAYYHNTCSSNTRSARKWRLSISGRK